ncbi:HD domain-containing protein [Prosthecochloris sp. GSB1]|uniref:HD domain-containing protein n=1 Tax=Prosthecochloris sp. GSB1 TaxID=281093 RepID=UPI001F46EC86|nr:HD domain-containing protein [Prosthecochloris sp. GSB1]
MAANTTLLRDAYDYVLRRFEAPAVNVPGIYHDLAHTRETVEAGRNIAEGLGLSEKEVIVVELACWFHDIGYLDSRSEHEQKSADIAETFLRERDVDPDTIKSVRGCILATKIPQNPENLLEQVVCDADLSHLGSPEYSRKNKLLRTELEKNSGKTFTRLEWLQLNIDFFRNHEFFTSFARRQFNQGKTENLISLYEELREKKTAKKKTKKKEKRPRKTAVWKEIWRCITEPPRAIMSASARSWIRRQTS